MSSRCMAAVFERYPTGGGEFALALALADNAHDDGGRIFPGIETMAHTSRQSVRAVQVHLRHMLAIGWLQLVKNGRGGRGVHAEYRINPDWLKGAELAPFSNAVENPQKGADLGMKRVQNDAQKGADLGTPYITVRTSIEPIPPYPPPGGASAKVDKPGTPGPGTPGFDAIAAEYPRRAGMAAARAAWDELAPDALLQAEISRAIKAWKPSDEWQRDGRRYIPKLAKFLRDKRWLDAPGTAAEPRRPIAVVPRPDPLTPEQLAANKARADAALAQCRAIVGVRQRVEMAA